MKTAERLHLRTVTSVWWGEINRDLEYQFKISKPISNLFAAGRQSRRKETRNGEKERGNKQKERNKSVPAKQAAMILLLWFLQSKNGK